MQHRVSFNRDFVLSKWEFFIFQRKIQIPPLRKRLLWCVAKA
jgi:hypothetical protein